MKINKLHKKILFISTLIFTFLFAGCLFQNTKPVDEEKLIQITGQIDLPEEWKNMDKSGRSAYPDGIKVIQDKQYTVTAYPSANPENKKTISFTGSSFKIAVTTGEWVFEAESKNNNNVLVLRGKITKTINESNNQYINIKVMPIQTTTGKGSANLGLAVPSTITKIKAVFYEDGVKKEISYESSFNTSLGKKEAYFWLDEISSGSYTVQFYFYSDENMKILCYYKSEDINIFDGLCTDKWIEHNSVNNPIRSYSSNNIDYYFLDITDNNIENFCKHSFFVDGENGTTLSENSTGTFVNPFKTMDDAFTYIKGNTKVESIINIYLTNNASVTEPITPINGKTIYIQSMDMDDGNPWFIQQADEVNGKPVFKYEENYNESTTFVYLENIGIKNCKNDNGVIEKEDGYTGTNLLYFKGNINIWDNYKSDGNTDTKMNINLSNLPDESEPTNGKILISGTLNTNSKIGFTGETLDSSNKSYNLTQLFGSGTNLTLTDAQLNAIFCSDNGSCFVRWNAEKTEAEYCIVPVSGGVSFVDTNDFMIKISSNWITPSESIKIQCFADGTELDAGTSLSIDAYWYTQEDKLNGESLSTSTYNTGGCTLGLGTSFASKISTAGGAVCKLQIFVVYGGVCYSTTQTVCVSEDEPLSHYLNNASTIAWDVTGPFAIGTKEDLELLRDLVNGTWKEGFANQSFPYCTFKLIGDINLEDEEWHGIGYTGTPFCGKFDGQNHTIYGMNAKCTFVEGDTYKTDAALFGYVCGGDEEVVTEIKNLIVKGKSELGGIIYSLSDESSSFNVENCKSYVEINNTMNPYGGDNPPEIGVGGIACLVETNKADTTSTIKNCINYGNITSSGAYAYCGGIVGLTKKDNVNNGRIEVKYCTNYGTVSSSYSLSVGGIMGCERGYSIVEECTNEGVIFNNGGYVGGIIGWVQPNVNNSTCKNCTNKGLIGFYDTISSSIAGGIVGIDANTILYEECINEGIVYASNTVGGIVGNSEAYNTIKYCENRGSIGIRSEPSGIANFAGGIVGRKSSNNISITDCKNTGNIKGSSNSAGILGKMGSSDNGEFINCINEGKIEGGADTKAGGIIGSNTEGKITCKNCENNGTIGSTVVNYAGGIIGSAEKKVTVDDCTNNGSVKASNGTGGIVGYCANFNSAIPQYYINCKNTGTIEGMRGGGIAGFVNTAELFFNIYNCINSGIIKVYVIGAVSENYCNAAGIVAKTNKTTIKNCVNTGYIFFDYDTNLFASISTGYSTDKLSSSIVSNCFYINGTAIKNDTEFSKGIADFDGNFYDSYTDNENITIYPITTYFEENVQKFKCESEDYDVVGKLNGYRSSITSLPNGCTLKEWEYSNGTIDFKAN